MADTVKDRLIRKFEDEIQTLNHELKLELPKEIKRARELGDLRENAEYAAAKERQRLVEARISMLQTRVSEIHLLNVDRPRTAQQGSGRHGEGGHARRDPRVRHRTAVYDSRRSA